METKDFENGNNPIPENPKDEIDSVVNTWLDVVKTPTISAGHFTEDDHFINISTNWSVLDIPKKENVSFFKYILVLKSSLVWPDGKDAIDESVVVTSSEPVPFDGKKIHLSKDGNFKAILLEKKGQSNANAGSGDKSEILQLWNRRTLLKTYDLGEMDKHKSVYTTGAFGSTIVWSPDSKKLALLAEKKIPKSKPFFSSYGKKNDENETKDEEISPRGEEFALKQNWGEQLKDMHNSVIVILDVEKDDFKVLEFPKDEFPTDIQWLENNAIVGTSYKIPIWRLGLIYCSNRESRIFKINVDGSDLCFLSKAGQGASSPRVRPDGQYIIWQERDVDGPHRRPWSIMGLSLQVGDTVCLYNASPSNEIPSFDELPQQCWTPDGQRFFFTTQSDGRGIVLEARVNMTQSSLIVKQLLTVSSGMDSILCITNKFLLISRSSSVGTPSLELLDIFNEGSRRAVVIKELSTLPRNIIRTTFYGRSSAPSLYYGPEISTVQPNSVGLIVWPHGGPHSVFGDSYSHEIVFFLRLGFAILQLNYIGSLGTKKDETDVLLGHIGTLDVQDCQNIVDQALKSIPCLNPNQVFVFGGSHGGFLTGHLTSSFPEIYKAAVMRNPVCDLNVMIGTSDITDWVLAESGLTFPEPPFKTFIPDARNIDEAKKYMDCSPITKVSMVKAPTLLLLGSDDLRVPMTQGLAYYRALKAHGKTAEVRVYPDCHPLSTVPVRTDCLIHAALWFKKFVK